MATPDLILEPYRGFGSGARAFLMGRLYRQRPGRPGFRARIGRRGVGGVHIDAALDGVVQSVVTDKDGYFTVRWDSLETGATGWRPVTLEVSGKACTVVGAAEVHMRPPGSSFVVISDIDDTVVVTKVANKARMFWRTFFQAENNRAAFAGVPAFYRALQSGRPGGEDNPLLFVSRGPWSIYDVLARFFADRGIAERPLLLLREWGLTAQSPLPRRPRDHKRRLVVEIMEVYGDARFVLIGDNGQHDPELYAEFVRTHPGRISAVYIRIVDPRPVRRAQLVTLLEGDVPFLQTDETAEMVRHAAGLGLIAQVPEASP